MNFHKDNLEALQKFQQMLNAEPDQADVRRARRGPRRRDRPPRHQAREHHDRGWRGRRTAHEAH